MKAGLEETEFDIFVREGDSMVDYCRQKFTKLSKNVTDGVNK